ncbi:hypothetical protein [Pleurocapsa sp. FMAR1]|uniref:hypothetical protein n=1 Tax=Pleurocapsa sp. FMAR1 TaxID=3040204 RepID=UPI0029C673C8|nr:hypothetical protein [Pleurocapsa sp. FMAR1]
MALLFATDGYNNLTEANEDNNLTAVTIQLVAADITITDAQALTSASVNDTITTNWTVENIGDVAAPANWYDSVYLSDDE